MGYEYDHDCPFEAFITNLGKYNEGELVGEWVKFPTTSEELQQVFTQRRHEGFGVNRQQLGHITREQNSQRGQQRRQDQNRIPPIRQIHQQNQRYHN